MKRAVFLDRDGVINQAIVKAGLPISPSKFEEFVFSQGIKDFLDKLTAQNFLKIIITPFIASIGIGLGLFIWSFTSESLGQYGAIDSMLQKAVEASADLKQEYYQGNSFDLGEIDPTISGVLSKFPIATMTGLFRPFLWEARNVVMFASGIENSIILLFVFYVFFRRPGTSLKVMFTNPLVLFCLIFAVFFAFSVAISTSNFGAMVRLRIPQMPFLLSGWLIIYYFQKEKNHSADTSRQEMKFGTV